MKSKKSIAELQIEEAINHMEIIINKQNVRIPDAKCLADMACKILLKCEELRKSRDIAITRRDFFMDSLRKEKKSHQHTLKRLKQLQELEGER
jgi:hypothetical protein